MFNLVKAAPYKMNEDEECNQCHADGSYVCRSSDPLAYSAYCCTEDEIGEEKYCKGSDKFCTDDDTSDGMKLFACPYSPTYCGSSSSQLIMHPTNRNYLKLQIQNDLYITGETCYYEFLVPDQDLDKINYRYFWDVEIFEQTGVDIFVSSGRDLDTADDTEEVDSDTGYRFQYEAESNRVYLAFTAQNDESPTYGATVTLRSFKYNSSTST